MPSQLDEVANVPFFGNPELFWEDLDVEEDPEKIQQEVDECIMVVKAHNEKRWLEWEDWKWKEEQEQRWKEEEEGWERKEKENQKKEGADKDAYEKKLVKARKTQLQVSRRFPFLAEVEKISRF